MSRDIILKARCTVEELDALRSQLTPGQTLTDLIRARLGLDQGNPLPTVDPHTILREGVIVGPPSPGHLKRCRSSCISSHYGLCWCASHAEDCPLYTEDQWLKLPEGRLP